MNERERAAYYDAHRDDPQEFAEVVQTPAHRKRDALTVTVAVRFSAPEAEALSEIAQREGKTYSEVIRTAVQRYARPESIRLSPGGITLSSHPADSTETDAPRLTVSMPSGRGTPTRTVSSSENGHSGD